MWFVDVFFTIVRCDLAKNYMFFEIHNWCKWLECNMGYGKVAMTFKFLHIPYRYKIEQPATWQRNEIKNSETEMCMWKWFCWDYLEVAFLEDEHHIKSYAIRQYFLKKLPENN